MTAQPPDIEDSADALEFARALVEWRKNNTPGFSLRSLARQVGYKSHSQLWKVLNGQADMSADLARALGTAFKLSSVDYRKWMKLTMADTATAIKDIPLPSDVFLVDMLVLALMHNDDARLDPDWFSRVTRGFLSTGEVVESIQRLSTAGVSKQEDGRWVIAPEYAAAYWQIPKNDQPHLKAMISLVLGRLLRSTQADSQSALFYMYLTDSEYEELFKEFEHAVKKMDDPSRTSGSLRLVQFTLGTLTTLSERQG